MATRVYGASDDLIEFEGDVVGEVGHYVGDDTKQGALIICSDGTLLEVKYGKAGLGIWAIQVVATGTLLQGVKPCDNEDAEVYSDVAKFADGLRWAYAATKWERVK